MIIEKINLPIKELSWTLNLNSEIYFLTREPPDYIDEVKMILVLKRTLKNYDFKKHFKILSEANINYIN